MALNGLDNPQLQEALKEAQAQADAWILLKYVSRDEVDVLSRGHGGFSEAKDAVSQYTELSPLYGFLSYRGCKVLLKHIPDGTSRLLQARTTVHFQDFSDAVESHDAMLSTKTSDEIDDVSLSEACSLPIPGSVEATRDVVAELRETKRVSASISGNYDAAAHIYKGQSPIEKTIEHTGPLEHDMGDNRSLWDTSRRETSREERRPSTSESVRKILATWEPEEERHYTRPAIENRSTRPADQARSALPVGLKMQTSKKVEADRPRSTRSHQSFNSRGDRPDGNDDQVPPLPKIDRGRIGSPVDTTAQGVHLASSPQTSPNEEKARRAEQEKREAFDATGWIPQSEATSEEKARLLRALELRKKNVAANQKPKTTEISETIVSVPVTNGTSKPTPTLVTGTTHSKHTVVTSYDKLEQIVTSNAANTTGTEDEKEPLPTEQTGADALQIKKRRPGSGILRIDPITGPSDQGSVTDDSLLDELQNAQVQKATPVSVAGSPLSPTLETSVSRQASNMSVNPITVRSGSASHNTSPNNPITRARTPSHMSRASTDTVSLARVGTVSKGISARIQALAEHSSREPSPNSQTRDLLTVGNLSARPSSRGSTTSKAGSRSASPSRSAAARVTKKWGLGPSTTSVNDIAERRVQTSHGSVTGRGLYRPFTTQQTVVSAMTPKAPHHNYSKSERPLSPPARPGSRESNVTTMSKKSTESGWRFFSRRKAEESRSPDLTMRSLSSTSLERVSEDAVEEKQSRAGRLLKRMSGMSAGSKNKEVSDRASRSSKNGKSPTIPMTPAVISSAAFTLGDLNVQFPDSLLWKRRWVEVDGTGGIVLAAVRGNENPPRGSSRRYRLAEFRQPIIPAHDRQELSNSIMLDLESGGGTLQLAFQDAVGQRHFMRKLLECHSGWRSH